MERAQRIKQALDRVQAIFAAKPEKARFTKGGTATVREGLLCEYTEEGRTVVADMPEPFGGDGTALSPGGYARAGLSMCLAIGYAMRAAHRGIPVNKVEVHIEADTDFSSLFGVPGVAVGYSEFRYRIRIESDAAEAQVLAVIEEADARSPVLDSFRRAQKLVRSVTVAPAETV